MSTTTAGRFVSGLTRAALGRRTFIHNVTSTVSRLNSVRSLAISSQRPAKSTEDGEEVNSAPIKFSTSKASHKTWKVDRSLGSQYERPWWRVLPVSLLATIFLLWCALREETDIDAKLEKHLYEHLPGLLSDEQKESKSD